MDHELEEFLEWLAEERKRTPPKRVRFPQRRQTWAAEYARRQMASGVSLRGVMKELTVSEPALRRWIAATTSVLAKTPPKLRAVTVKREPAPVAPKQAKPRPVTVITPHGFRVEGLDEKSVVALLRALG